MNIEEIKDISEEIKIETGDTVIDKWGNKLIILDDDCGTNTYIDNTSNIHIDNKLYEYEDGKYICGGNIDKVLKKDLFKKGDEIWINIKHKWDKED